MKGKKNTIGGLSAKSLLLLTLLGVATMVSAAPQLKINSAKLDKKTGTLQVKASFSTGTVPNDTAFVLFHGEGGILESTKITQNKQIFEFTIPKERLAVPPCEVGISAADAQVLAKVGGAPKDCGLRPVCQIISPQPAKGMPSVESSINTALQFSAKATLKDKSAAPLKYQWDFAGGAMGHPDTLNTTATFIRDNGDYRVRFAATDSKGHRCEAAVNIKIGNPPAGLPAKVGEQPAAKRGEELTGNKGDVVVLPFEDWSMQHRSEMRLNPNGYVPFVPIINNLNALVYRKDRLPVALSASDMDVRYSAASNPLDPVGLSSINSTSHNFPLNAQTMFKATLQKTDIWDNYVRGGTLPADYRSLSWVDMAPWSWNWRGSAPKTTAMPDEGYLQDTNPNFLDVADQPGSQMPGKSAPYTLNEPKPFAAPKNDTAHFAAKMIPVTDIDDKGRVNPYPLLRVEAVSKNGQSVVAKTDGVLSNSRDFKCRECHGKGGVAANPNAPYTQKAYLYSAWAQRFTPPDLATAPEKPQFFEAASNSIEDQEYAAALNFTSLHDFYDNMGLLGYMQNGMTMEGMNGDSPQVCYICHGTALDFLPFDRSWWKWEQRDTSLPNYDPDYSISMHKFHGQLQWKDAAHSDIKRDSRGVFERWTGNGANPNSLFPIFDKNGKQLPMEENCLKCHSGHREQLYRDRMYSAGVSCFDCHGDMLAMGATFKKSTMTADKREYREPWFDEPDCGSCHTGNGNIGKDKANGFFSAGAMKTAFDSTDPSATSRKINFADSDAKRFAVMPVQHREFPMNVQGWDKEAIASDGKKGDYINKPNEKLVVDTALFKDGKDMHGNVVCAACHGAAHAVWPNQDPKANDNVTALQLQGHTGTILECNVCHTADAFKEEKDLDGGQYSGDSKSGILGGPHNMHPVNDPYWWKNSAGGNGGWHKNYAQIAGAKGEDQCAACHGSDHKGTRLAKTPVARDFVNDKGKAVHVEAGVVIGCDFCHTIEKSCTGSPNANCGK